MKMEMEIKIIDEDKETLARRILEALPQWFGIAEARERYIQEARELAFFACIGGDGPLGFLTLKQHYDHVAEVHAMGVLPRWHRHGIGRALLARAEDYALARSLRFLTVKTLAHSHPDPYFGATRRFYEAMGFLPLEELPELWPDNPCLMMIKHLVAGSPRAGIQGES